MKTLVILTALVCGSVGNILQNKFGTTLRDKELAAGTKDPKLIGGHQADWSQFPYVVAITNTTYFKGAGAIIAENFVITHYSTVLYDTSVIKVRHGSIEKNVAEVIFHRKEGELGSDEIALIKLEDKFDLSGPNIKSIELRNDSVPVGTNCTVVGVGARVDHVPADSLQYISVPTVSTEECEAFWNNVPPLHDNYSFAEGYLCSGVYGVNFSCSPTAGDSLVCDGVLAGVTTILSMCMSDDSRAVYGDVAYYKQWIEDQLSSAAVSCLSVPVAVVSVLLTTNFSFKF